MEHRNDGLEALQLIPLVPFDSELVLPGGERSDVPRYIIAPAHRLHPVHAAGVHPDQVAGPLQETVHGDVGVVEVLQHGPPRAVQVVDLVLLAEGADGAPVGVRNGEPLAVAGADVDVYRAEVVVLLVSWSPTAGNLENVDGGKSQKSGPGGFQDFPEVDSGFPFPLKN